MSGRESPPRTVREQIRRACVAAAVVALAAATGVAVRAAWRVRPTPDVDVVASRAAVAAAPGAPPWRATGPVACDPGRADVSTPVDELRDGRWTALARVPLAVVAALSRTTGGGVAFGRDGRCLPAYAASDDGGRSWSAPRVESGVIGLSAGIDGALWRIRAAPAGATEVVPPTGAGGPQPCGSRDGTATHVDAVSAAAAWVLCESHLGPKLLARTSDGGRSWQRVADERPGTGLGGDPVRRVSAGSGPFAATVFDPGTCPEGEVRVSRDHAVTWTAAPCLGRSHGVAEVLDVAVDAGTGRLLVVAVARGDLVTLGSGDLGRTWRRVAS